MAITVKQLKEKLAHVPDDRVVTLYEDSEVEGIAICNLGQGNNNRRGHRNMKLNTRLFRLAAENIADGSSAFCCCAIGKPETPERMFFVECFCPPSSYTHGVWFSVCYNLSCYEHYVEGYIDREARDARVIALLLCELLAKEHNKESKGDLLA